MILFISFLAGIIGLLTALYISLKHNGNLKLKVNLRKMEIDLRKDEKK